eukprot:UN34251
MKDVCDKNQRKESNITYPAESNFNIFLQECILGIYFMPEHVNTLVNLMSQLANNEEYRFDLMRFTLLLISHSESLKYETLSYLLEIVNEKDFTYLLHAEFF